MNEAQAALRTLTLQGLAAIAESTFGISGCKRATAYYDSRKDELVTTLESFQPAVDALAAIPAIQTLFGVAQAKRLAIQFVFNACRRRADGLSADASFEEIWEAFSREARTPIWTFAAVANMQNVECSETVIDLVDGISVRGRSQDELSALLNWGPSELDYLSKDWMEGAMSSFVLLVQSELPKVPDNFILANDGTAYPRAARALLSMRLLAPGDVRIGRLFFARPATFNVGIGGMTSSGFTVWHPGPVYKLTPDEVPRIARLYANIRDLERQSDRTNGNVILALRSFSSIYDRFPHQAEDRVLDAITVLEALWKVDLELSFKLAYRTAALLALSDDERVSIYETVSEYYKIRCKIVHGSALSDAQTRRLNEDEPLRSVVRRVLNAFLHVAADPREWTLKRLYDEVDTVLLHTERRKALQVAMGIRSAAIV